MKHLPLIALLAAFAAGCKRKIPQVAEAPADNAATRYVGGMQSGVEKAQSVADKANASIQRTQAELE